MGRRHIGLMFCFVSLTTATVIGTAQGQDRLTRNLCESEDREVTCRRGVCDPATGNCVQCLQDMDCIAGQCDLSTKTCRNPLQCVGEGCGTVSPTVLPPDIIPFRERIRPPIIVVPSIDRSNEVEPNISTYTVNAKVNGLYATVMTEFTIENPNRRVMEGELEFPLPDDAIISGYAIDVNGVMTDAQVVEKKKARIAFENEVKKGVDPGLVEQIKGNEYRTRIYPIPAQGGRRIRVEYTTPLMIAPNGDAALALPMPNTKLKRRDISISVVAQNMPAPAVGGLGDKRFEASRAVWVVESHDNDVTPGENVLVAMPNLPDVIAATENFKGDQFFVASVKTGSLFQSTAPAMPNKWRIIWDASGSRTKPDIQQARQLIESLPENAQYELHVFRNEVDAPRKLDSRTKLLNIIDTLEYDGGTDFSCLEKIASQRFDGITLFFTDGMDTMTGALPQFGTGSVAVLSGSARDVSAMRKICGGRTINLDISNGQDAIQQILTAPAVASSFEGNGITDVEGIGNITAGRITILGRLQSSGAAGTLRLSDGRMMTVNIPATNVTNGKTLASAWAANRIDDLSPRAEDNREELLAIGRKFSIVSPVSSLLVLENLNQWLEYDIEPPETLVDIHEKWLAKRQTDAQKAENIEQNKAKWLRTLRENWDARVAWWNDPVPYKAKPQKSEGRQGARPSLRPRPASRLIDAAVMLDEVDWSSFHENSDGAAYGLGASGGGAAGGGFGAGAVAARSGGGGAPAAQSEPALRRAPSRKNSVGRNVGNDASRDSGGNIEGAITVQEWDPDTPYLKAIKDTSKVFKSKESIYAEYIKQREKYSNSPAFYLDCATLFFKEKQPKLALRILSNLSELKIDDVSMLRVYAWRLREAGDYDNAITILRKVTKIRSDEAISWRDLALTLTMRGKEKNNVEDIQEALTLFHKTAFTPWNNEGKRSDARWTSIIALEEFNELVAWTKRQKWSREPIIPEVDPIFLKNLDMDIRIMMTWDTDSTDIDMHVIEPSLEEVYYKNKRSRSGGLLSHDITTGYGPEEFLHKIAPKGKYTVKTNYYASHQQSLVGPATITVTFYTNWGRKNQTSKTMSLRLEGEKEKVKVGEFVLK